MSLYYIDVHHWTQYSHVDLCIFTVVAFLDEKLLSVYDIPVISDKQLRSISHWVINAEDVYAEVCTGSWHNVIVTFLVVKIIWGVGHIFCSIQGNSYHMSHVFSGQYQLPTSFFLVEKWPDDDEGVFSVYCVYDY